MDPFYHGGWTIIGSLVHCHLNIYLISKITVLIRFGMIESLGVLGTKKVIFVHQNI